MKLNRFAFVVLFLPLSLLAQDEHHPAGMNGTEVLGRVSFPTSCASGVQLAFDRAVALLHSFQYEEAKAGFTDVAQKDPHCAMAYWGQAMSLYHELWEHPNSGTIQSGRALIAKGKSIGAKTQREREFIDAVAAFYQDSPSLDYAGRSKAYSQAMEQVYVHNPQDGEAAAFYALSLIAQADPENELANRKKAIAILDKLFVQERDHPGVVHYLIHATDTPQLASLGLEAARRYAKIAPSSAHALHMPSHIFTRLGLWQESIESNIASEAAAEKLTARHLEGASYQMHAMDFLDYAYLQSGQEAKAEQIDRDLESVPGASADHMANMETMMAARNAIELHHWKEAASLPAKAESGAIKSWPAGRRLDLYFAAAVGAARSRDAEGARQAVANYKQAYDDWRAKNKEYARGQKDEEGIQLEEAEAWLAYAEGKSAEAVQLMGAAADQEDKNGVDSLTMPAREMLGDLLLELHQGAPALAAYEAALAEAPNRFDGLYGAAEAAKSSGAEAKAKSYFTKLIEICGRNGGDRPELDKARTYLAEHQRSGETIGGAARL